MDSDVASADGRLPAFMAGMDENAIAAPLRADPSPKAVGGFEAFFLAERGRLFRALILVTHDSNEAEEIMQDSFCKLWERWDRVGALRDPTGYLYRTSMNGCRSAYRRTRRAARALIGGSEDRDPFEAVAARDEAVHALARLTPRQRAAVVLTELIGYSSEEAGEILGIRAGTVRTLVSQARASLAGNEAGDE